ncbi:MAG: hypothetical protein IPL98_18900 [Saprospiraceae bacterium]|nr:hypothetical protein [Saprospiraceae bacterium]
MGIIRDIDEEVRWLRLKIFNYNSKEGTIGLKTNAWIRIVFKEAEEIVFILMKKTNWVYLYKDAFIKKAIAP